MRNATLAKLIWVLIYGGLLLLALGVFVRRQADAIGGILMGIGATAAAAGIALVLLRAARQDD